MRESYLKNHVSGRRSAAGFCESSSRSSFQCLPARPFVPQSVVCIYMATVLGRILILGERTEEESGQSQGDA